MEWQTQQQKKETKDYNRLAVRMPRQARLRRRKGFSEFLGLGVTAVPLGYMSGRLSMARGLLSRSSSVVRMHVAVSHVLLSPTCRLHCVLAIGLARADRGNAIATLVLQCLADLSCRIACGARPCRTPDQPRIGPRCGRRAAERRVLPVSLVARTRNTDPGEMEAKRERHPSGAPSLVSQESLVRGLATPDSCDWSRGYSEIGCVTSRSVQIASFVWTRAMVTKRYYLPGETVSHVQARSPQG